MTKSTGPLLFFFLFPLLVSFNFGGYVKLANATTWCVAKPSASDVELTSSIDYACNVLPNCSMIQPGGSCYLPNTLIYHASVVMDQYYAENGRNYWNCDFSGTGFIVSQDPSYGDCKFA
ncbi:hypothetical protein RJT34_04568 [Clitoria ternatea]|uniref:X8 domain-containing protein n=1 Tax=Clitoria ternatea TaxID=43366 RepID=A0AAN9KL94_CLITE